MKNYIHILVFTSLFLNSSCVGMGEVNLQTDLSMNIGKKVTLEGTALNEPPQASILLTAGGQVFICGLDEWDQNLDGKTVIVSGILQKDNTPPRDSEGRMRSGVFGCYYLDSPKWKLKK